MEKFELLKILTERQFLRREKILSTARDLITMKGYKGVTMRELAKKSNVTPKTLYDQFGSKEKLMLVALKARFREAYEAIASKKVEHGFEKLFFVIDAVMENSSRNSNFARGIIALKGWNHAELIEIRKATYLQALAQIRDEGDFLDWVDIEIVSESLLRVIGDLNLSYFSSDSNWTEIDFKNQQSTLKLHSSIILSAYTRGETKLKAIAFIKACAKNSSN